jgi:hypothetical protein
MKYPCDHITERLATGETLTANDQAHVTSCVDCARLARVPGLLAATAREPEPDPGFSARMHVGARGRLAARRRNRVVATGVAAAATFAIAGVAITRTNSTESKPDAVRTLSEQEPQPRPPPVAERPATAKDEIVLRLVNAADVDTSLQGTAPWDELSAPLVPYRALLAKSARKGASR